MASSAAPAVVKKLDETVVNRIAAGEVIQRPANALKELLENSLDAKSTNIQITVKNGGLKLLQIQDNGTGIRKDDLGIVCERFTTSKLTQFEDLNTITTFGFRGEALASISHVAHLTIITKTASDPCAYKASYEDSKLKGPPKACAGNQGTQIIVEDLFYNVATRRKSLRSSSEEHMKIADVVSKYSIHNPTVGFTLRKQGESSTDVRTNPNSTHVDNIRCIYGLNVAKGVELVEAQDDCLKFTLKGYMSNANFPMKKQIFLLFINNRLVDSQNIRKTLEQVYSLYLPKGMHPFLYLSLSLDPRNVDVNVHPTKHEVHFLHEDVIIDKIKIAIEAKLTGCNTSRIFYTQTKLPGEVKPATESAPKTEKTASETAPAPNYTVRNDPGTQKIDKFFSPNAPPPPAITNPNISISIETKRDIKLTSVVNLKKEIESNVDEKLKDILRNFSYVGAVNKIWCVIQHQTELYICNNALIFEEMFYQMMISNFGNFHVIKFSTPLYLPELISIAMEEVEGSDEEKAQIAKAAADVIDSKKLMLNDYFATEIDENENLLSIPLLLDNYTPSVAGLPSYALTLATEVNWEEELPCFKTFCEQTASFYAYGWKKENVPDDEDLTDGECLKWTWTLEHVLYPAIKKHLLPSKKLFNDRAVLQIASLPQLYKVFERC
ncbi:DNA mismatch repair protein Mlh1 isoform X1 [Planococcus citri]|uniref:DNA mismatch repair protein Mlh1 isoform X1 n=1 Tax=Planococcus citri TaxID=170843 RepID=UPI0031F7F828